MAPAYSKWTMHCAAPIPWTRFRVLARRDGALGRKLRGDCGFGKGGANWAHTLSARSCCWPSPAYSIHRALQQENTSPGRIATFRMDRKRICWRGLEDQIERFAPGFREFVLARRVFSPAELESMDANLVGGDIGGGAMDLRQFLFRPTWQHYATSAKEVYICSSSTPPGGGVHGMCGYHAAKMALARLSSRER